MGRFIEGCERRQALLLADCVDDYVGEENPVRVIDVFVDELDLATLGFEGAAATGRPGYHPATLLKLYLYGYMNQVQSSRRLISYIWTREGWLYLAVVLDLYSRRVVGWAAGDRLHKELALTALRRALVVRQPGPGLLHHSDRGIQYCSNEY